MEACERKQREEREETKLTCGENVYYNIEFRSAELRVGQIRIVLGAKPWSSKL